MKETEESLEDNLFVSHTFLLFSMPINLTEIEKLKEKEKKMEREGIWAVCWSSLD